MSTFDFDAARRERDAKADPPTMKVGGEVYTLPSSMPAAVTLDLMALEQGQVPTIGEVVRLLGRVFPPDTVDGWVADGWTHTDLYELMAVALAMVRGVDPNKAFDPPADDEDGGSGEGEAPNGRGSSSKGSARSKPTSSGSTRSTSRARTRSRS